jgi:hypothetical protein
MIYLRHVVWLAGAALIASGCRPQALDPTRAQLPSQLFVPPWARDVRPEIKPDGEKGVMYTVEQEFPADTLLAQIRAALPSPEWRPLAKDWLNPDSPSSHERGWRGFGDATRKPATWVHQWVAQWQDSQGDVVWYALRYDSKARQGQVDLARPDNPSLSVTALWVPALVAREMIEYAAGSGRGKTR